MIGTTMMKRSVMASRVTWIHSLRSRARRRRRRMPPSTLLLCAQHVDEHVFEPRLDLAPRQLVELR